MTNTVTITSEIIGMLWIAIPVLALFAVAEVLYRTLKVDAELTRKTTHLGSGLIVFFLPWAVQTHWSVLALAGGFAVLLGGTKLLGWLPSVHRVGRTTRGAEYYPIAIYLTFLLAGGDLLLFGVPVLVMALSDTGAAVVGKRYGIVRYRVIEDHRSLVGSVTFFGVTFAVVLVGLGLAGHGDLPSVLLITLLTALIATAVEGISVRGADNLLVPYSTFVVLRATLELDRDGLGAWVLGTALVLGILLASFRQSRLNATGFMAVFVGGTLAWGFGGPVWLATLLVPYFGYAASRPVSGHNREADLVVMVPAFAVSLLLVLLYSHLGSPLLFLPFLASVASVSAISLAAFARRSLPIQGAAWPAALLAAACTMIPAFFMATPLALTPTMVAVVVGGAMVGPALVQLIEGRIEISPSAMRVAGVLGGTAGSGFWAMAQLLA